MKLDINVGAENAMEFFKIEESRYDEFLIILNERVNTYLTCLDSLDEEEPAKTQKANTLVLIDTANTVEELAFLLSAYEGLVGVRLLESAIDEEE